MDGGGGAAGPECPPYRRDGVWMARDGSAAQDLKRKEKTK